MPRSSIAGDATFRDVLPRLSNPDECLRIAVGQLSDCHRQRGNSGLRMGVTGTGQWPSIKVIYQDEEGRERIFGAYSARIPFSDTQVQEGSTWSTTVMSYKAVRDLLGDVRSAQGGAIRK
jgi:hypothetical protein